MKKTLIILILFAMLVSSGCSTIIAKHEDGAGHPFSGTQNAALGVGCSFSYIPYFGAGLIMLPFAIADLALSFVADLVVLPVDIAKYNKKSETNHTCF